MANHFADAWNNAYEQVDLPDTLSEYAAAASAAFDAPIVASLPTAARFDRFNGINVAGRDYIDADDTANVINTNGHEIYYDLGQYWVMQRQRPVIHLVSIIPKLKIQSQEYLSESL